MVNISSVVVVIGFLLVGCSNTRAIVEYSSYYPVTDMSCKFTLPESLSFADKEEFSEVAGLSGLLGGEGSLYLKDEQADWVMISYIGKEGSPDILEIDKTVSDLVDTGLAIVNSYSIADYEVKVRPDATVASRDGKRPVVTEAWFVVNSNRFYFVFAGEGANESNVVNAMREILSDFKC